MFQIMSLELSTQVAADRTAYARQPEGACIRRFILASSGLALFHIVAFLPLWTMSAFLIWDARAFNYPSYAYLADSLRQLKLPLWDPFTTAGVPFQADTNNPILSPVAFALSWLVPFDSFGFVLFTNIHWILAGSTSWLLAKSLGAKDVGAWIAAIQFMACGFLVGHAQHTTATVAAAWIPLTFAGIEMARKRSGWQWPIIAGLSWGLSSYGGYTGLFFMTPVALAMWVVIRHLPWLASMAREERIRVVLRTYAVPTILATALFMPNAVGLRVDADGYTERARPLSPRASNFENTLTFPALATVVIPTVLRSSWDVNPEQVGRPFFQDISGTDAYSGLLSLVVLVLALLDRKVGRSTRGLILFAVVMYVLAFGGHLGLRTLLYYIFPPLQYTRHSTMFRLYGSLAMCMAVAVAISHMIQDRSVWFERSRKQWILALGGVTLIALSAFFAIGVHLRSFGVVTSHAELIPLVWPTVGLLLLLSLCAAQHITQWQPVAILVVVVLLDSLLHVRTNSFLIWIPDKGPEYLARESYLRAIPPASPNVARLYSQGDQFNYQLLAKVFRTDGYVALRNSAIDLRSDVPNALLKTSYRDVVTRAPKFWLTPAADTGTQGADVLRALERISADDPVPWFISDEPLALAFPKQEAVVPGQWGRVQIGSYEPERITLLVEVPSGGGYLASTERYARAWRAWIDGEEAPIHRGNLGFRGLMLPEGVHDVRWEYQPAVWLWSVKLSLALTVCCLAVLLWERRDVLSSLLVIRNVGWMVSLLLVTCVSGLSAWVFRTAAVSQPAPYGYDPVYALSHQGAVVPGNSVLFGEGFYRQEGAGSSRWRWMARQGRVVISSESPIRDVSIDGQLHRDLREASVRVLLLPSRDVVHEQLVTGRFRLDFHLREPTRSAELVVDVSSWGVPSMGRAWAVVEAPFSAGEDRRELSAQVFEVSAR